MIIASSHHFTLMKVLLSKSTSHIQDNSQALLDSLDLSYEQFNDKMEIEPGTDLNLLIQALMSELALLRKQLSKKTANNENEYINIEQMLECIQMMKVQFRYNREQYNTLENEHKKALLNLRIIENTLTQYEQEFADKKCRIQYLENQLQNEQLQVKELTDILRKKNQQQDSEEIVMTNQMLIQLQQLQLDYEHQKKAKLLENKCDELQKQNQRYQKQLQELQKQISKNNYQDMNQFNNDSLKELLQNNLEIDCPKCNDKEFQLQLEQQNTNSLQQRIEILQSQLNRYINDPQNVVNQLQNVEKLLQEKNQELDALKEENMVLEQQKQEFQKQQELINELQEKIESLTKELEDKFREIDDMGMNNENLEETNKTLKSEASLLAQQNIYLINIYEMQKLVNQQKANAQDLNKNNGEDVQNSDKGHLEPSIQYIKENAENTLIKQQEESDIDRQSQGRNTIDYNELLQLELNLLREKAGILTIEQDSTDN